MTGWSSKTKKPAAISFFAPQWYVDAKSKGASHKVLRDMVRNFCQENLPPGKEVSDTLVTLTMNMYEGSIG